MESFELSKKEETGDQARDGSKRSERRRNVATKTSRATSTRIGKNADPESLPGYDDGTEFLTRRGWVKGENLRDDDRFATLDQDTFELEFQEASRIYVFDYKGEMYRIENQQLDLKVTPNHNMWVKSRGARHLRGSVEIDDPEHREAFSLENVKDIVGKARRYLKTANWKSVSEPQFIQIPAGTYGGTCPSNPGFKIRGDRWAEFMGWYITEGSAYSPRKGAYRVEISQSKEANPKHYKRIRTLLTNMGLPFQELDRGFIIAHKGLYEKLKPLGRSHEKYLPREVLDMGSGNLKRCLDAMIAGDGCTYTNEESGHYGNVSFTTTSKRLAGNLQEIAIKLGYSANLKLEKRTDKYAEGVRCYYLSISNTTIAPWTSWGKKAKKSQREEMTRYEGKAYCPAVPNGVVMVRRSGKHVWSGSGFPELG
ncbi:hypothetical protein GGP85_003129 [Salinibacter ruber]|uniref:LAGLIDADG family homing endonuclease n=1 Tax=Salinibacter ruber TaxID=146919 RepID=UPI002168B2C5|nr:LAGLIDADG family homing endonuclease [Salinibacter ruber]MCS3827659.1 hypothetical protein [Salinibacter ruber]